MIPKILKSNDMLSFDFGLPLKTTLSCNVVEELNGKFELNLQLLNSDEYINYLKIEAIILVKPNTTSQIQPFVIEQISKDIDGLINVYATHIAQYRTKLIPIAPFKATNLNDAINKIKTNSLESNPFTFLTDKTVNTPYVLNEPKAFRSILGNEEGSIIDVYKGEYYWDVLNIKLLTKRGRDNQLSVVYGKNMVTYQENDEFSWSNSITGVIPFYKSEDDENNEVLIVGDVQYSKYAVFFPYKKTIPYDVSDKFDEIPTKADVEMEGLKYVEGRGYPNKNIQVSYEDISTLPQYKNIYNNINTIELGNDVLVINNNYKTQTKTRIRELDFDVLLERYNNITIGDAVTSINEAISDIGGGSSNSVVSGGNLDIDKIYPVGSIYMSVNSTSPSTFIGGTWEQIKDTFLLSCGDTYANGSTGGEASVVLNGYQIPSHYHGVPENYVRTVSSGAYNGDFVNLNNNGSLGGWGIAPTTNNAGGTRLRIPAQNTNNSGGLNGTTQAHNNMPPYLAVYVWKRTA